VSHSDPLALRLSTTNLLWTISCRTQTGGPYFTSTCSTVSNRPDHAGAKAPGLCENDAHMPPSTHMVVLHEVEFAEEFHDAAN
jgi:glucose dehydrogenase